MLSYAKLQNKPRIFRSLTEKEHNQKLASERVIVEYPIGSVKRSRIVHDPFRNRKNKYVDIIMETAGRLHNFRVSQCQKATA